jgi:hypothetical protein
MGLRFEIIYELLINKGFFFSGRVCEVPKPIGCENLGVKMGGCVVLDFENTLYLI